MTTLTVSKREVLGKHASQELEKSGEIPGVLYGSKTESTPVSVSVRDLVKVLRDAGETTVLTIEGLGKSVEALIHEVDMNPLTNLPRHIDLLAIVKGEKMEVQVPLSFVGDAPALKTGARVVKVMHEVTVIADGAHLPHEIEVSLEKLQEGGDQIHIKDLTLPGGVTVKEDPADVVVLAQVADEEEPESAQAVDIGTIEVAKKGKAEGEEG